MDDPSFEEDENGRSVIINDAALEKLGSKIANSILSQPEGEQGDNGDDSSGIDGCINNLQFAAWDEEDWHYTGENYDRSNVSREDVQKQRFERVALYILVMDCINFCFWPLSSESAKNDAKRAKNGLEYEPISKFIR